jgi:SMI1 / KNR4 family (SUKH-1)
LDSSDQATVANPSPGLRQLVDHAEQIAAIQLGMPFPIDENQIQQLEESLGASLPESYKSFMLPNNGGEIELADLDWELHPIKDASDRKRLARTASHVLVENQSYAEWHNAAPDTLSIGEDGCGNRIVLRKLDGEYQDEIFAWDHETGELTKLADSITEATRF